MATELQDFKKFLKPEAVSRLGNMNLVARLVVEGFITGLHRSPYHGFSVEFAEYRQYMPGDDIRHIDWKVYGKTDRFYVKQFEEETNLKSYILLDSSASMSYSSHQITKFQYATYMAAALTYLMLKQRDSVGLVTFAQKIKKYLPPRSVNTYLSVILQQLQKTRVSSTTNIAETFHQMAERINRRGLIIVLSDLMDNPEKVISGLKHFRHKKHEIIVFHILDPLERTFDFKHDSTFIDLESGEKLATQPWHIRTEYRKLVNNFIETYKSQCLANRIDYVLIDTMQDFDRVLLQYLIKRKRIGG
ncbi:DUF58 domain-containing protein [candidate division KSB1 bacterium]|nr:DUF58 domain-containing protein [candidate division KSB1 bacterium]